MTTKTFWYIIILVVKRDTKKLNSVQTLIESLPKKKLKKLLTTPSKCAIIST
nr:MAG TPA: hypothetical protein [Caudoviricetes sp.]